MNSELIKIKLKKYISQYEYLNDEYTETMFLFNEYKIKFYNTFPDTIKKTEPIEEPVKESIEEHVEEPIEEHVEEPIKEQVEESIKKPVEESVKIIDKLYKSLSLKTHPDKNKNSGSDFITLNEAYKNKDIIKLLIMAKQYNIEIEIIDFTIFEKSINDLNGKIKTIKTTLAWKWEFADENDRNQYREIYKL